jgi:hypothetical protein
LLLALGNPVKTHMEACCDPETKVVHVLDLDQGRTVTNAIDNIYGQIFQALKLEGDCEDWQWYLYATDGLVSRYIIQDERIAHLPQDDPAIFPLFMGVMKERLRHA